MKKVILAAALGVTAISSYAQVAVSGSSSQASTQSTSLAGAASNNAGNAQDVIINTPATQDINYSGTYTIKNTPSVNGPNLTTSNDTCMGSTSGSVNIAGLGIVGGTSWTDKNCVMLKNSRELWNMGMKQAALARMCMDANNKAALEMTGFECPQTTKEKADAAKAKADATKAQTVSSVQIVEPREVGIKDVRYTGTDPIVRARLGLSPVAGN